VGKPRIDQSASWFEVLGLNLVEGERRRLVRSSFSGSQRRELETGEVKVFPENSHHERKKGKEKIKLASRAR